MMVAACQQGYNCKNNNNKFKKSKKPNKTNTHLSGKYCVFAVYAFSLEGFPSSSGKATGGRCDLLWEWFPREIPRIQA